MNRITTIIIITALLSPVAANALGLSGFYMVSVPFAKVEYVSWIYTQYGKAEISPFGFGAKAWYNFTPALGVEGFFSYVPEYRALGELISDLAAGGGFRINNKLGPLEPYGSAGAGLYWTSPHGCHPCSGVLSTGVIDPPSTDFGLYFGPGILVPVAGPANFDFNPTYSAVFAEGVVHYIDIRFGVAFKI